MAMSLASLLLLLSSHVFPLALAYNRPNDLSLSTINPSDYDCNNACQKTISAAIKLDREENFGHIPFSYDFYATSVDFDSSKSKPGDLLKVQAYIHTAPTSAWDLPGGTTLFRIQYVSLSLDDKVVPATAFVAFPFVLPGNGTPFNMVAFAHGTIGTTYGCAPSSSFNLYDYDTVFPLLLAGYAVVGADYAGLGNNYTRPYWEANTLNANDVIFSAVAAKKAWPALLSKDFVAMGHSQGGGAAWGVAESTQLTDDLPVTLIGSVPLEPGVTFADEVAYGFNASKSNPGDATALAAYAPYVYAAIDAFHPSVIPDIFTPAMIKRMEMGQKLGMCFYLEAALTSDLGKGQKLSAIIKNVTLLGATLERYQAVTGAATGQKAKVPMLVVQSVADRTVPAPVVEKAWNTTCAAGGEPVELSLYPALDHSAAVAASAPEWLEWIADRFAGVDSEKSCQMRHRQAVNVSAAYLPLDF